MKGSESTRSMDDVITGAHHEAGHAVAAACMGLRIVGLDLVRQCGQDGVCWFDPGSKIGTIVAVAAGGIAEMKFSSRKPHDAYDTIDLDEHVRNASTDLSSRVLYEGLVDELKRQCTDLANRILDREWNAVQMIAIALAKAPSYVLSPESTEALLKETIPPRRLRDYQQRREEIHKWRCSRLRELTSTDQQTEGGTQ